MDDFMSDDNETGGRFVKWTEEGEEVFGVVLSFSVDGGTAFDGGAAPRLVVQPVRRTGESWYDVEFTGEENALVNGGPNALQNLLREKAHRFQPGYLVRLVYVGEKPTKDGKRTYKAFQDGSSEGKPFKVTGTPASAAPATTIDDDEFDF